MGKKNSDIVQGKIRRDAPFEPLYNLTNDLSQTENVVTANPAIAHELGALLKHGKAGRGQSTLLNILFIP